MFTVVYKCRVHELGTNKEITDHELALDISLQALIGERDQPLHPTLAPEHCAVIRATKRAYLLVRTNLWTGAHVLPTTKTPVEFVFRIPVQQMGQTPVQIQDPSIITSVLSVLAPALSYQFQHPEQTQNVDGEKYRIVLQGAVKVAFT
jgi:hypothetical protein